MGRANKVEQLKKAAVKALYENMGNVSAACAAVGIGRTRFYDWKKEDPAFTEAVDNVEEFAIDQVENSLMKKIREGDTASIIFFLKCRAKSRGYIERQELSGPNGGPIQLQQITGMEIK